MFTINLSSTYKVLWRHYLNVSLSLPPVQNSGLLCQPDPEASQATLWPQLSTDTVLWCCSVRGAAWVTKGRWGQHRRRLHHVWPVRFCANSAHQNCQYCRRWRGLCQPSMRESLMPWMVFVQPDLPPQDGTLLLVIISNITGLLQWWSALQTSHEDQPNCFTGKCLSILDIFILFWCYWYFCIKAKHLMLTSYIFKMFIQ